MPTPLLIRSLSTPDFCPLRVSLRLQDPESPVVAGQSIYGVVMIDNLLKDDLRIDHLRIRLSGTSTIHTNSKTHKFPVETTIFKTLSIISTSALKSGSSRFPFRVAIPTNVTLPASYAGNHCSINYECTAILTPDTRRYGQPFATAAINVPSTIDATAISHRAKVGVNCRGVSLTAELDAAVDPERPLSVAISVVGGGEFAVRDARIVRTITCVKEQKKYVEEKSVTLEIDDDAPPPFAADNTTTHTLTLRFNEPTCTPTITTRDINTTHRLVIRGQARKIPFIVTLPIVVCGLGRDVALHQALNDVGEGADALPAYCEQEEKEYVVVGDTERRAMSRLPGVIGPPRGIRCVKSFRVLPLWNIASHV